MRYRYLSDSHTHSRCSFDGRDSVALLARQAVQTGLYALTVTDHCECNEYFDKNVRDDIASSVKETSLVRLSLPGQIRIRTGIELGQPTQDEAAARDALSLARYDFVLGSLHNLRGEEDFYFLRYNSEAEAIKLFDRYLDEMYELVQQNLFDSLAHLDYPLRYMTGEAGIKISDSMFSEKTDAILELLAKNGKALEVNTSGLRQKIGRTLPGRHILRRFYELGGRLVTVGSDAHRWGDVGAGIEDAFSLLLECGFTSFAVYENRVPELLPIK